MTSAEAVAIALAAAALMCNLIGNFIALLHFRSLHNQQRLG